MRTPRPRRVVSPQGIGTLCSRTLLFAGYALASIPLLLLFLFMSKYFLAGLQGRLPGSGR